MKQKILKDDVDMDLVNLLALHMSDYVSQVVSLESFDDDDLYDKIYDLLEKFFNYPQHKQTH